MKATWTVVARVLVLVLSLCLMDSAALAGSRYSKPYYIQVDLTNQVVTVYETATDSIARQMICSTGLQGSTPRGTYYLPRPEEEGERESWYYFSIYDCYAQYATRIIDNVMFHSIPCSFKSQKSISQKAIRELGQPASHGCIRLRLEDARFIAENCEPGTRVEIAKSRQENEDLRQLLLEASYDGQQPYAAYLATPNSSDMLGLGSEGQAVMDLQARLRNLGIFAGEISGVYHGDTVNAVRRAQGLMGLTQTGVADADFRQRIFADDAPVACDVVIRNGSSGPAVRLLQQELTDLRIYDGPLDGVYDPEVTEALNRFQIAYGYKLQTDAEVVVQKAIAREIGRIHDIFDPMGGFSFDVHEETVDFGRVEANSGIRVRNETGGHGEAIGHVDNGGLVLVLERGEDWSRVQHGADVGYVSNDYMDFFTVQNPVFDYIAPDGGARYQIGHTRAEYAAGTLAEAETFSADAPEETPTGTVNTGRDDLMLNLRAAADREGTVVDMLPNGSEVALLLDAGEWWLADHDGERGYLMKQFIDLPVEDEGPTAAVVRDRSELKAWVKPNRGSKAPLFDADSDDADVVGSIKGGVAVKVVYSTENGYSLITNGETEYYIRDEDLLFSSGKA